MKTLLVMRHAKSSWDDASLDDHDRPLNKRGRRDAPRIGRLLAQQELTPDLIVSSTALRARQTAEAVAEACGFAQDIRFTRKLYHADVWRWIGVLRDVPEAARLVLAVGHNPGIEELVETLSGTALRMPTAAVAGFDLEIEHWREFSAPTSATLRFLWRPRELGDET